MYRQQQSPIMTVVQTIFFLIVLGAVLFVGFYVFLALLPFILAFIIYIWYKYKKAVKAFQAGQANGEYQVYEDAQGFTQNGPFVKRSVRYVYSNKQGANEDNQAQERFHISSQQPEYSSDNFSQEAKNPESIVYDIAPEDYSVEDKK